MEFRIINQKKKETNTIHYFIFKLVGNIYTDTIFIYLLHMSFI